MNFRGNLCKHTHSVFEGIKKIHNFFEQRTWLQCIVIGVIMNFAVESLSRHSVAACFVHIVDRPLVFIFNSLIFSAVLSLCALFKRKYFFYLFFILLWLGFGIANAVILNLRITPLEWADIKIVRLSIINVYLTVTQMIVIGAALLAAVVALVVFFIKCPKVKIKYIKASITSAVFVVTTVLCLLVFRQHGILLSDHVKNLAEAYSNYGFNYCFMSSMLDIGIDKPPVYEETDVNAIAEQIKATANSNSDVTSASNLYGDKKPNVIFLQLESFFDINHISGINYSEDPIPNFSKLQNEYSSGYISVPSIGAGTANTEFEIISGMSLDYFGVGEYPYKTILQSKPSESLCFDLKDYGYSAHAIHNNTAVFYDRNVVFSNLGFDTFTSIEYMNGLDYTYMGWAKDSVLVPYIEDALNSTEGQDFVYAITVQGHGKYPSDCTDELKIETNAFSDDPVAHNEFEYYINQLSEVDAFIGNLIDTLSARDEKTIVVMYGDHLPNFNITENDLTNGDLFQTEYVIWDNFGLNRETSEIPAYRLGSYVMGRLGLDDGLLTKLHQNFYNSENYVDWLKTLQYDMLYGKQYAWGGENNYPYKNTSLKMGIDEITLSEVSIDSGTGTLSVTGNNFTEYSTVFVGNTQCKTVFTDENHLSASATVGVGDMVSVIQVDIEGNRLGSTKPYLIGGTKDSPAITAVSEKIIYVRKGPSTVQIVILSAAAVIITILVISAVFEYKKKKRFIASTAENGDTDANSKKNRKEY